MDYYVRTSIGYKDVFQDYETVSPSDLIEDIPSVSSLKIICHFAAQVHASDSFDKQIDCLKTWCRRLPKEVVPLVAKFIHKATKAGGEFNFMNSIAACILVETILENHNPLDDISDLSPKQELNLFKAYLWCNQYWTDKQTLDVNIDTPEDLASVLITSQIPYYEVSESKDFISQTLKAVYFFKFCEEDDVFSGYLDLFLEEYGIERWQDYLDKVLGLYVTRTEPPVPSVINIQNRSEIRDVVSQFCIDVNEFSRSDDFKSIREKPVYKLNENSYLLLSINLLIDKLFQGIQFELFRVLKAKQEEYNEKRIKSFDQFRSIYAEQISEKGIFYRALKDAFNDNKYKSIDGQRLKKELVQGEPDFYIRDKGKIYLFEYKDVIINADVKYSFSFDTIKEEILKKMVSNEKSSPKGITQLFNSIVRIKKGDYSKVDNYKSLENCTVYPIIVFTDTAFNLPGINYLLNKEFSRLVETSDLKDKHKVKGLTLIDINTFLMFQDLFREKKLNLSTCLNEYSNYTGNEKKPLHRVDTFNSYIRSKTKGTLLEMPTRVSEELKSIIANRAEKE